MHFCTENFHIGRLWFPEVMKGKWKFEIFRGLHWNNFVLRWNNFDPLPCGGGGVNPQPPCAHVWVWDSTSEDSYCMKTGAKLGIPYWFGGPLQHVKRRNGGRANKGDYKRRKGGLQGEKRGIRGGEKGGLKGEKEFHLWNEYLCSEKQKQSEHSGGDKAAASCNSCKALNSMWDEGIWKQSRPDTTISTSYCAIKFLEFPGQYRKVSHTY